MNVSRDDSVDRAPHNTDRFAGAFNRRDTGSASSLSGQEGDNSPASNSNPASPVNAGAGSNSSKGGLTSASGQAVAGLNPRSCVTCRKRKVKCDKRQPCSNCQKAHIECIFPRPGRAPRKAKKPPDAELLARLRRLEGVVQKLGKGASGEDIAAEAEGALAEGRRDSRGTPDRATDAPSLSNPRDNPRLKEGAGSLNGTLRIEKEMGNLVVGEGKSRYVSNTFWASLTEEVAEMREMIGDPSGSDFDEDEETTMSPESQESASSNSKQTHQEFLFGYSSTLVSLRILHPPSKQIMTYWDIYTENVDPVLRILHKPTSRRLFALAARDHSELSRSGEALVFAVYFGVVTSLTPQKCQQQLGLDREIALKRFRFATEQALARAGFLATQELLIVQAFSLFLTCVRRNDETKSVWTMTGMLMRMACSLGLHRDGTNFNLPPFQTEMRRRLWWQVCTLDVRSSEDQGADPMVAYSFFDTKMPLNVNDVDIWPDMKDPPVEHEKCTEMTFDLVRYEIGGTVRLLAASQSSDRLPETQPYVTLEAKETLLEKLRMRLEDNYLRHCDMAVPLQWVAANVARLVMAKIWLVIHHPFRKISGDSRVSEETRNRTFLTSIDVIRYSRMLETQNKTSKWGWLFRTYFQWHAVAFLLNELCVRTSGTAVDEAWEVLAEAFSDWENVQTGHKKSMLWKPIQKLTIRAKAVRIAELHKRRTFPEDGSLGPTGDGAAASAAGFSEPTNLQECRASASIGASGAQGKSQSGTPPTWQSQLIAQQRAQTRQHQTSASPGTASKGSGTAVFSPPPNSVATSHSNVSSGMDVPGLSMADSSLSGGGPDLAGAGLGAMGRAVPGGTFGDPAGNLGFPMDPMQGDGLGGASTSDSLFGMQLFMNDPFLQDNDTWDIAGHDAPWADMMAGVEDGGVDPTTSGHAPPGMSAYGGIGTGARADGTGDMPMDLNSPALWGAGGIF